MNQREVRFAEGADEDLIRLFAFLCDQDTRLAERALTTIRKALAMAASLPFTCRKAGQAASLRECVIPFGRAGYVAAFEIADDHIMVLAIRHQREDDYH